MVKHLTEKRQDKSHGDTIAKPARRDDPTMVLKVDAPLKVPFGDEVPWIAFCHRHPGPDFRDKQTDVMIDPEMGTNIAGCGDENGVTREQVRDKRGVEVDDWGQGIERPFRERTFRTGAGRGRGFTGYAADELHEEFGQFKVVNRI